MGDFDSQGRFVAPVDVIDPTTEVNNFTADGRFIQPVMLIDPTTGLPYAPGSSGSSGALTAPTLFLVGDSQVADGWQPGSSLGYTFNYRIPMWVRSGLRYRLSADFNTTIYAFSGYTTTQWIATYMANCVAAIKAAVGAGSTPLVVMKLGTNDCAVGGGSPASYAATVANFETIFTALCGAGAIVFPVLILPRSGSSALSANGEKLRNGLNSYLTGLGYRNDRRIVPINTQPTMCGNSGVQTAGFFAADGLHPSSTGAKAEGGAIASFLAPYCPADIFQLSNSASDTYDATYNPLGNRVAGLLSGTTGTKDNAQVTGNVATGYHAGVFTDGNSTSHATAGSHMTAVGSLVTSTLVPGLPMQQFVLGGTGAASPEEYLAFYASNYPQGTGWVAGDVVEMGCYIEWDAGLTNVCAFMNNINLWFQQNAGEGLPGDQTVALPSAAGSMLLVTNPITIPTGYSNTNLLHNVLMIMGCANASAIAGTVRVGAPFIRKVA